MRLKEKFVHEIMILADGNLQVADGPFLVHLQKLQIKVCDYPETSHHANIKIPIWIREPVSAGSEKELSFSNCLANHGVNSK